MKRILMILCILLAVAPGFIGAKLFLIGEPIDGNTLTVHVDESPGQLNIQAVTAESAMAFTDARLRQRGTALHISFRKVLVSPIHSSGTKCLYLEKAGFTEVYLGGRLIWQAD